MIILGSPESVIAIGIVLFIAVVAFISTISNFISDKENKKLRQDKEMLYNKCVSLTEYSAKLMYEKEHAEYKKQFDENLKKLDVGDKNV